MMYNDLGNKHSHSFDAHSTRRVSFHLVTKNRAQNIPQALESFRKLVGPEDELIVIDGSTDDSTQRVVARHPGLVDIFVSEPDFDGTHAQNKAMLLSRGKYLRLLTDDDIFHPEGTEKAIRVMETHPEIDLLVCGGTKERDGRKWSVYVPPGVNYGSRVEDPFLWKACGAGFLVRRSSLAKVGAFFPSGPSADVHWVAEFIRRRANVKFCRLNTFHHPIYSHSVIIKHRREHRRDHLSLVRKYCSRRFYFSYRLRLFIRAHPFLRRLLSPLKRALSGFSVSSHSGGAVVWDGGFS